MMQDYFYISIQGASVKSANNAPKYGTSTQRSGAKSARTLSINYFSHLWHCHCERINKNPALFPLIGYPNGRTREMVPGPKR
jgi:hypothetical protein